MTITATSRLQNDRYVDALAHGTRDTDGSLQAKDMIGGILAAVMTLAPLAATALAN